MNKTTFNYTRQSLFWWPSLTDVEQAVIRGYFDTKKKKLL